ncbi:MAG: pilus assembly protein PilP [Vicinamibacteria bacterium]|jgi:hypothetical protein|nr:pilus assembly protein PilP [Vicinamibacteria bacterium]
MKWMIVALLALAAGSAAAQAPAPAPPATPPVEAAPDDEGEAMPMAPPSPDETIKGLLGEDLETPADGYQYSSLGRRDPFVSLLRPVSATSGGAASQRPKGPTGFLVQELTLRGIVRTADGFIALVQGPDGKSYPMRVGQKLYDGEITGMDGATMTLNQRYTDEFNRPRVNTVKKSLYPSEEARQ